MADSWLDAFALLRTGLEKLPRDKRKVLFLDETPWMDTPKSGFLTALEHFWNSWASGREDLFMIVCGSASSWIVKNLLKNKGGLHNRVTKRMRLLPFTLGETEQYLMEKEIDLGRYRTVEAYMILGGVPYYLSLLGKSWSLPQNIDKLCFDADAPLRGEFKEIYTTLFKQSDSYIKVVEALSTKSKGLSRDEIIDQSGLPSGGWLSRILEELELCGFIRSYPSFALQENLVLYQLTDQFSLFHLRFMKPKRPRNPRFWSNSLDSPALSAWRGYAFEQVCLAHIEQIKQTLGVHAISTEVSSWRSRHSSPGAQIDLLIDRRDDIINLCEMKFSKDIFTIDAVEERKLRQRLLAFESETRTKKAIHLTMLTTYGIVRNKHSGIINSLVNMDDLFTP
jgi:hypothetical protein